MFWENFFSLFSLELQTLSPSPKLVLSFSGGANFLELEGKLHWGAITFSVDIFDHFGSIF